MQIGCFAQALDRRLQFDDARRVLLGALAAAPLSDLERLAVAAYLNAIPDNEAAALAAEYKLAGIGRMSEGATRCLRALIDEIGRHGRPVTRQATIARRIGCSRPTVERYMRELRSVGIVRTIRAGRRPAFYLLSEQKIAEMFDGSRPESITDKAIWAARQRAIRKAREVLDSTEGLTSLAQLVDA